MLPYLTLVLFVAVAAWFVLAGEKQYRRSRAFRAGMFIVLVYAAQGGMYYVVHGTLASYQAVGAAAGVVTASLSLMLPKADMRPVSNHFPPGRMK
ncbi:hypothetical protein [Alkalicoccus luteus]|uniref:Uncharacterized protein n=1 Tax=Alkalicoccus luteus TaxID=1237094 RepID=A0A969PNR5_9BACI|nr:hypothetical protein [Alkalicoccus luteus]NJP37586.1 hypothetical protein [Alkalicoccus luteus]